MLFPELKGVSPKKLLKHLFREVTNDAITDTAAQLSYYFLFAMFPFLFFLVTVAAYLPLGGVINSLMERLQFVMPEDALLLVEGHLNSLVGETRPKLLTLGLAVTLWTASRGVDALRKGLNLAYDVPESRPIWHTQLIAVAMTVASAALVLSAFTMFILGGEAGAWLAAKAGVAQQFQVLWSWARWPFTAAVVMFAAALLYYFLPDVKQRWRYITPGSVSATALWLITTWGFTQYVDHFGRFNVTYGSIGGVMVLLLWLYLTGLVFIVGGEINAVLEHESAGGKVRGARAEGEAPLPLEERPSVAPPSASRTARVAEKTGRRAKIFLRRKPSQ